MNERYNEYSEALSTLSQKSETVAEIRRQSHFSATLWTGYERRQGFTALTDALKYRP